MTLPADEVLRGSERAAGRGGAARLVGREKELAAVCALPTGAAIVVRGAPGTGRSAVLGEAAAAASAAGRRILHTAGAEAEQELPFAALHRLLHPLADGVAALGARRREALQAVFGLADPSAAEPYLVGLGTLELLGAAAAEAPLQLVVDDTQWLDAATLDVVLFVARRLASLPCALVVAVSERGPAAEALEALDLPVVELAPLGDADAQRLLDRIAPGLAPVARWRCLHEARGNPLALVELPVLLGGDSALVAADVPLSPRLEQAFAAGLNELPAPARAALLAAAVTDAPALVETLAAASAVRGEPVGLADLAPALGARLVRLDGATLRFPHRLTRTAVRVAASTADRHATHAAIAALAEDPGRRAWHRAACATAPDEALAMELDAVARSVLAEERFADACGVLRRAAELSVDPAVRDRRLVGAAELAFDLGAPALAARLVRDVDVSGLAAPDPCRLATLRQRVHAGTGAGVVRADAMATLALTTAALGHPRAALDLLHATLAGSRACGVAAEAEPVLAGALATLGVADDDPLRAAVAALEDGAAERAAAALREVAEALRAQRRTTPLLDALVALARAELQLGDYDAALAAAGEAVGLAAALGRPVPGADARCTLAFVAAIRGEEERAGELATAAARVALPAGAHRVLARLQHARALAALGAGRPAEALEHLERAFDPADPAADRHAAAWAIGDLVDAAVGAGRTDLARAHLAAHEGSSPAPHAAAALALARALLDEGDDEAGDAVAARPFLAARIALARGMRLRRQRHVADSRAPLRAARDAFAGLGARPWEERARQELDATAESARGGDADGEQLTPRELEIARMAAQGLTNKEIGARLALSPRTVSSHLQRIFPKLDVASRAGIAAALERGQGR